MLCPKDLGVPELALPPWLAQKLLSSSSGPEVWGLQTRSGKVPFRLVEINDTLRRMLPALLVVGGSQNKCLFIGVKLLSDSIPLAILSGYNLT